MGFSTSLRIASLPDPVVGSLLDGIDAPAALVTPDLEVLLVNKAARDSDPLTPGLRFVAGAQWTDLCRQADAGASVLKLESLLDGIVRSGDGATVEYTARRRDRFRAFRLTARGLEGDPGQILVIQNDTTQQWTTEQRLAEAERQLKALVERLGEDETQRLESLSRLAGGLAHEMNNTLLPVMMLTELAIDELPEGSPARGDLERVIGAAEHARALIQRLMTFSRSGRQGAKSASLDVAAAEAAERLRITAPSLHFNLRLRAGNAAVPLAFAEVQQIIADLGRNAVQALGGNGGTITIETAVVEAGSDALCANPRLDAARRHARLTVADDGPGIAADVLPNLFAPFFTTRPVGEGMGLGLAVVHGLVTTVGGVVNVSGDDGARFDVFLPIVA